MTGDGPLHNANTGYYVMRKCLISIVAFHLFFEFAMLNKALAQSPPDNPPGEGQTELSDAEWRELFERINPPEWDYTKVVDASEVIVIATLLESVVQPSADDVGDEGDASIEADESVVAVESRFDVKAVLKGKVMGDQLTILHWNWQPDVLDFDARTQLVIFHKQLRVPMLVGVEGPAGGKVPQASVGGDINGVFTPEYLLFLKRAASGMYEPASGQRQAAASVRIINLVVP